MKSHIRKSASVSLRALLLSGLGILGGTPALAGGELVAEAGDSPVSAILVTASRADTLDIGGAVHRLDSEELARFDQSDPNRVFRAVPGVFLQEEEGFGLRPNIGIRGSGTDRNGRITVMEDGVLIAPAPYAAPAAYYFPRLTRIRGIEVAKGPAAIKYGPLTIGGAINLQSAPIPDGANPVSGEAQLLAGNHGGLRAHGIAGGWAPVGGFEVGAMIEGLHESSDGFKRIDSGGSTGFEISDMVAKLALRAPDAGQHVELKYQRYDERSDETYLGLTLADFRADPFRRYNGSAADRMDVLHETFQLSHGWELAPGLTLTTIAYHHRTGRAWYKLNDVRNSADTGWVGLTDILENPAAYATQMTELVGADGYTGRAGSLRVRNNKRDYEASGIQTQLAASFETGGLSHQLEISARYHEDSEDRFQNDDRYTMVDGRPVLASTGAPGSQDNRLGEGKAWAFFLRDTIEAGDLTLVPGLRYETIRLIQTRWSTADPARQTVTARTRSTVDVLIPGLSATWRVAPAVRIIGGVHKGFAPPGPGSTAGIESSWNYEAGVRLGENGWRADIIGFFNDYENLVGTCTASSGGGCEIGEQFDGGEVDVKGIEASAAIRLKDERRGLSFPVTLAYTYTDARFQSGFASGYGPWGTVQKGDRLPYMLEHQLALTAGIEAERARLSIGLNWVSEARAEAGQGAIPATGLVDERLLVDLAAGFDITPGLEAFVTVQNLFDERYAASFSPAGARPGAPRLALAGLRARF